MHRSPQKLLIKWGEASLLNKKKLEKHCLEAAMIAVSNTMVQNSGFYHILLYLNIL